MPSNKQWFWFARSAFRLLCILACIQHTLASNRQRRCIKLSTLKMLQWHTSGGRTKVCHNRMYTETDTGHPTMDCVTLQYDWSHSVSLYKILMYVHIPCNDIIDSITHGGMHGQHSSKLHCWSHPSICTTGFEWVEPRGLPALSR